VTSTDPFAIAAFWIAVASFALALFSVGWQVYAALRVDRAVIRVELLAMQIIPSGREVYLVTVTNAGRRPTELTSIHLAFGPPWNQWLDKHTPRRWRRKHSVMVTTTPDLAVMSTTLPRSLDVGATASVSWSRQRVEQAAAAAGFTRIHGRATASTTGSVASKRLRMNDKLVGKKN